MCTGFFLSVAGQRDGREVDTVVLCFSHESYHMYRRVLSSFLGCCPPALSLWFDLTGWDLCQALR